MSQPVSKARKSAFVAIVGRPSVGKSTLLNSLCGHKVAIVSDIPQTTRNRVRGIVTRPEGQLVFIDTPGFHQSKRRFNRQMRGLIQETIRDSELVLYVADGARHPGNEEEMLLRTVAAEKEIPTVVALNKMDLQATRAATEVDQLVRRMLPGAPVVPISAKGNGGLEQLLSELFALAPDGDDLYPDEYYTDQPPEFRVSELIREKAIAGLKQELPHSLYVEVADLEVRDTGGDEDVMMVRAFILVERESQKGIVVGKAGSRIKQIRQGATREIEALFPYRVELDLRVKVDPNWRDNELVLRRLVT
jgi:GTP-binding protein Era